VNSLFQLYPFEKSQQQNNAANVSTRKETNLKLTANRKLILSVLDSDDWTNHREHFYHLYPPFTCLGITNFFEDMNYHPYPSIKQIERTMRDLVAAGLVNVVKQKTMVYGSLKCEKSVNHYELPHQSEKNRVKKYVVKALSDADLFFENYKYPSPRIKVKNYDVIMKQLKTAMQRAHPDKFGDESFIIEFKALKETYEALKNLRNLEREK
jgi:hypothetical protein